MTVEFLSDGNMVYLISELRHFLCHTTIMKPMFDTCVRIAWDQVFPPWDKILINEGCIQTFLHYILLTYYFSIENYSIFSVSKFNTDEFPFFWLMFFVILFPSWVVLFWCSKSSCLLTFREIRIR